MRLLLTFPLMAVFLAGGPAAAGETCPSVAPGGSNRYATVAAGPQYGGGWLHRLLLGNGYRTLWKAPIEVEVLDLQTFAGGLTPTEQGGGMQTRSLKLTGQDGRKYRFRSTDKHPDQVLPPNLRGAFTQGVVEDQTSAQHPAAGPVVWPLAAAAGILHVESRLVVLPDDPALGEFRAEFAGTLGTIEEQPRADPPVTPGFEDVVQVLDSEALIPRLDASPTDRIDARAFLRARLFDVLIGDWDRHWKQWDWVQRKGDPSWQPFPKDRDQAFAKYNGLVLGLARPARLLDFEDRFSSGVGFMVNSRNLDRRVLAELEEPVWTEVVRELQARLDDRVIDEAVCDLPPAYYRIGGARLAATLKARRDRLGEEARRFYRALAGDVDVFATAAGEVAEVDRLPSGEIVVSLALIEDPGKPYFRRRFNPRDTHEIRVYLGDGNDRVVTRGPESGGPTLRVIAGNGNDLLDERAGAGTRFYDSTGWTGPDAVRRGPGTRIDRRPYEETDKNGARPVDAGRTVALFPSISAGTDIGVLLGGGVRLQGYGFRARPYLYRHTVKLEYATSLSGFRGEYEGELQRRSSETQWRILARVSEIEAVRFYGFGNETPSPGPVRFYNVDQIQYVLAPSLVIPRGAVKLSIGPIAKHSETRPAADRFIGAARPYGSEPLGQLGALLALELDTREPRNVARRGVLVRAAGSAYPAVWSLSEPFGEVHAEAAAHLTAPAPLHPTLSLRVGGQKVWGRYPFHEAAFLGGPSTVRGLRWHRYAGDAALFGNAELRLHLGRIPVLIPADLGIFALADAGRVYLPAETSDRWHTALGGGLWLSFRDGENVVSLSAARSEGRMSVYLKGGLFF